MILGEMSINHEWNSNHLLISSWLSAHWQEPWLHLSGDVKPLELTQWEWQLIFIPNNFYLPQYNQKDYLRGVHMIKLPRLFGLLIKRLYLDIQYHQINSLLEKNTFKSLFEWVLSRLLTNSTLAKFLDHPGQELIMFFRKKSIRPTRVPRANRLMIPSEGREHFWSQDHQWKTYINTFR